MTLDTYTFKSFPEFSRLTLNDRREYESFVKDFPAICSLSFAGMMVWWNILDSASIAKLNDNLVISYWLPGMEKASGLSLVGINKVDESICTIFDQLRKRGDPVRLVHVPEMVIQNIRYPELFRFKGERNFDEYIMSLDAYYPLSRQPLFRRQRVKSFLKSVSEERVVVKAVDLHDPDMQDLLLKKVHQWSNRGVLGQIHKLQGESIEYGIKHGALIGLEGVGLFIDGELHGYCQYEYAHDKRYIIVYHARIFSELPRILDYMIYAFAKWFVNQGILFANLDMDRGLPTLRMIKVAMGPTNFFRKYTIEPVGQNRCGNA